MHTKWTSAWLATVTALLLTGCASTAPIGFDNESTSAIVEEAEPAAPSVALDADTLYDILLGEIARGRGYTTIATESLSRAAERTRDPRLAEHATLVAFQARQYPEALAAAQLWVQLQPQKPSAREVLALVLLEMNQVAEAEKELSQSLTDVADEARLEQSYVRIAAALGRGTNRIAAIQVMRALVARHPTLSTAHMALAHLAVRAGELDAAVPAVDEALKLKPDWQEAALFKGRILVSQKQTAAAQQYFEDFLRRYPQATALRLHYARFLIDQKQWEKARDEFKRLADEAPGDVDTVYAAGLLALQTNDMREAEAYLKRALAIDPDNDQVRIYLGQVYEHSKRYDDAIRNYREVSAGEHHFGARIRLALVTAKQGNTAAARKQLKGIEIDDDSQQVQVVLAEEQILRDAGDYHEALQVLNVAVGGMPNDKDLLYARALVAEKLDMLGVLESDLRAILRSDPANVNALNALGYTLADRTERYAEAQELLTQALQLKPDDPYVLDSIGWLYYRMGNTTEAVHYLKRAIGQRGDAEIAAHLGEVLWVIGQRGEAESVWANALRDAPDSEALMDVIHRFRDKDRE